MFDISISIVTYNNEDKVGKAIESIAKTIPSELKYIIYVIDNCSIDSTLDAVRRIRNDDKVVIKRNSDNLGFGRGHNIILDEIESKIHIFVNPDILVLDNCIRNIYDFLMENLDVGIVSPKIYSPNMEIQYLGKRNPTFIDLFIRLFTPKYFTERQDHYCMKEYDYDESFEIEVASGCFMAIRTDLYKSVGGFDERFFMYFEDSDLSRKIREIKKIIYLPSASVIHEWERGSRKSFKMLMIMLKSAFNYFYKWGFKFS